MIEPSGHQKLSDCDSIWPSVPEPTRERGLREGHPLVFFPLSQPSRRGLLPLRRPVQAAFPLRQSLSRLCVVQRRFHSPSQAWRPRRMKQSQPRVLLICQNTGSTVWLRFVYSRNPRVASSVRSMRSRAVSPFGQLPRPGGLDLGLLHRGRLRVNRSWHACNWANRLRLTQTPLDSSEGLLGSHDFKEFDFKH